MRHIRWWCFNCQCHLHNMGQTRLGNLSLYSKPPSWRPKVIGSRAWNCECNYHQFFLCLYLKVVGVNNWSCAPFEQRFLFRKSVANQIGQNLNSIDVGHQNVYQSTWIICMYMYYIMSLLCLKDLHNWLLKGNSSITIQILFQYPRYGVRQNLILVLIFHVANFYLFPTDKSLRRESRREY